MDRAPYSKLSEVYDIGWGDFAESCQRFIITTLQDYGVKVGKILELACGTGILAIHLARAGHVVLGIDQSPEMVATAAMKGEYIDGVDFKIADMRSFSLATVFDAALCLFDSLNYLTTPADVFDALTSISAVLRPGGVFIFDFNRPLIYSAHNGETIRMRVEDGTLLQELHYEVTARTARTVFRFPNGDVETHVQRAYELCEIEPLLSAANLSMKACFSNFSQRPVSSVSERLICVCQKI